VGSQQHLIPCHVRPDNETARFLASNRNVSALGVQQEIKRFGCGVDLNGIPGRKPVTGLTKYQRADRMRSGLRLTSGLSLSERDIPGRQQS